MPCYCYRYRLLPITSIIGSRWHIGIVLELHASGVKNIQVPKIRAWASGGILLDFSEIKSSIIIFFMFKFSLQFTVSMIISNLCLLIVRTPLRFWILQIFSMFWLQDGTSNHLHVLRNIFVPWIQNLLNILHSMLLSFLTFLPLSLCRIWIVSDLRLRSLLLSPGAPVILSLNGDLDRHL